jgi:hypothetical protein
LLGLITNLERVVLALLADAADAATRIAELPPRLRKLATNLRADPERLTEFIKVATLWGAGADGVDAFISTLSAILCDVLCPALFQQSTSASPQLGQSFRREHRSAYLLRLLLEGGVHEAIRSIGERNASYLLGKFKGGDLTIEDSQEIEELLIRELIGLMPLNSLSGGLRVLYEAQIIVEDVHLGDGPAAISAGGPEPHRGEQEPKLLVDAGVQDGQVTPKNEVAPDLATPRSLRESMKDRLTAAVSHPKFQRLRGLDPARLDVLSPQLRELLDLRQKLNKLLFELEAAGSESPTNEESPVPDSVYDDVEPERDAALPSVLIATENIEGSKTDTSSFRCSIFFSERVAANEISRIIACIHLETVATKVIREAAQRLELRAGALLKAVSEWPHVSLPRQATIEVTADVPRLVFETARASMRLWEDSQSVEFRFKPCDEAVGEACRGWVSFWFQGVLIANIAIVVFVANSEVPEIFREVLAEANAKPYRRVFPSYSHDDEQIVMRLEAYAASFGDEYLRDVNALRTGQFWNEEIQNLIERADVFQLFWSAYAAKSKYVEKEWRRALIERKLRADPYFVRPVYWTEQLPPIPSELERLHFARAPLL